jgi:hypothetical protein
MSAVIQFEARRDDALFPTRAVVCTVWTVVEQEEAETPVVAQRAIVVSSASPTAQSEIVLPSPGAYLVDVAFPDGRHTRRTINVEAGKPYRFLLQDRRTAYQSSRSDTASVRARAFGAAAGSPNELEVRLLRLPALVGVDQMANQLSAGSLQVRRRNAHSLFASATPGAVESLDLHGQPPTSLAGLAERSWLIVSCAGDFPTLLAYPEQWMPVESPQVFRLVARRKATEGAESKKWRVSLELLDPIYGALIEYLTRRDLQSSETISASVQTQALQALYEKMENPFAAAAGAYLMALGDLGSSDRRSWMENLYRRFAWLPDGAIAWGWRLLREGERGSDSWIDARRALMDACARGLPYFTVGLHVLVDALTALSMSDQSDDEVRRMLAAVVIADNACVRTEPFTTIQVSRFQKMSPVK